MSSQISLQLKMVRSEIPVSPTEQDPIVTLSEVVAETSDTAVRENLQSIPEITAASGDG